MNVLGYRLELADECTGQAVCSFKVLIDKSYFIYDAVHVLLSCSHFITMTTQIKAGAHSYSTV